MDLPLLVVVEVDSMVVIALGTVLDECHPWCLSLNVELDEAFLVFLHYFLVPQFHLLVLVFLVDWWDISLQIAYNAVPYKIPRVSLLDFLLPILLIHLIIWTLGHLPIRLMTMVSTLCPIALFHQNCSNR